MNIEQTQANSNEYTTREEYVNSLKKWLDNARLWHGYCASFPYYMNLPNANNFYANNIFNRRYTSLNGAPFTQPGKYIVKIQFPFYCEVFKF